MVRLVLWSVLVVGSLQFSSVAQAENWMFRPSYYSHDPVENVRIGKQWGPGPYYTRPQGSYVRSGFRNMRSTIQVRGGTYDNLNVWESWIQSGAQY